MIQGLWAAATGMDAMKFKIDVIANNLANVNTDGFKRTDVDFSDLLYQYSKKPSTSDPTGTGVGLGTKIAGTTIQHRQGSIVNSDSNLDMAIDGVGFFEVKDAISGDSLYTRRGSFKLTAEGKIVTSNGYELNPSITLGGEVVSYNVGSDGTVWKQETGGKLTSAGQISLAKFPNPSGLEAVGDSLYRVTDASGEAQTGMPRTTGFGAIMGRALESSNVEIVKEMVDLITTQKAFDTNSKVITVTDKMMDTSNNLSR